MATDAYGYDPNNYVSTGADNQYASQAAPADAAPAEADNSVVPSVATGAAAGGSVGGPWGALIGAAAGLVGGLMNNQAAAKRQQYESAVSEHARTQNAIQTAQSQQLQAAGAMAPREQSAISQLIGVFNAARK